MNLADIKKLLEGPYKARLVDMKGTECAICEYLGRNFWVYLMPSEKVEQLVFSYISNEPFPPLLVSELNEFHQNAHVARLFFDDTGSLHLNAKMIGKLDDLSVKSFVMFLEVWMNDFDRILLKLHDANE